MKYDRFNLEEEIMNVWQTREDLNAVTDRIIDPWNGPMTEDQTANVLIGLSELFETLSQFNDVLQHNCHNQGRYGKVRQTPPPMKSTVL